MFTVFSCDATNVLLNEHSLATPASATFSLLTSCSISLAITNNINQSLTPTIARCPHIAEFNRFSRVKATSLIIRKSPNEENQGIVVVKFGELMVVLFVLFGWFLIIFLFIKKWGKIRGIETTASLPAAVAALPLPPQPNSTTCSSAHPSFRGQRSKESAEDAAVIEKMHINDAMSLFLYDTHGRRTSCFQFDSEANVAIERRRASEARRYKSAENLYVS